MKKPVLEIYAFAVCFFAAAVTTVALAMAAWDGVQLAAPEFTLGGHAHECHQSDDAFRDCYRDYGGGDTEPLPQGAQLAKMREDSYRRAIKAEQRNALQGLAQKAILVFFTLALFVLHWRIARRRGGESEGV